jgi:CRP-like cAMP-binding protein
VFLERILRRCPEAALKLATLPDLELARYEEWVGCLLPRKVEARLANLLPLLALRFGTKAGGGRMILPRLTHEELAWMVCATRESVTAALGDLRRRGMIDTKKGRILIL